MRYHDIQLTGSLQITGSLTLPTGTTEERPTNPRSGSVRLNTTLGVMEIYTAESGSEWVTVGEQTTPTPSLNTDIEYLLVAGGGAGGGGTYNSGGGGAGGLLSSSLASVQSGSSFTVTVGAGGTGAATQGNEGTNSTIAGSTITTITSIGGGGGGSHSDNPYSGTDGGSGGGGTQGTGAGGSGTVGQGNNGTGLWYGTGGGGGGAGEAGSVGFGNVDPYPRGSQSDIDGGDGLQTNITGTPTYFAGGGGGGERVALSVVRGNGGAGGGGQGGPDAGAGSAGTSNTGGGGGGSGGNNTSNRSGGSGGSGVAIFAYDSGSFNAVGGIVGDAGNGRKYNQFNTSGTFKVGNTSDFTIDTANLTGWWDAADYSSRGDSTWTDKMGNYNLTKGGTPTLGNNPYYTFQANGEYYNTNLTLTNGAKAMVLWIKYTGAGGDGYSLTGWQEGSAYCYLGRQDSNGKYYYYIGSSTGGAAATGPTTNVWYMLTLTNDASGNWGFYENNGSTTIASGTGINMGNNGTSRFNIGSVNNTSGHRNHAQIGMCFYYTKNLSTSDIANLYNATKTNFV